MEAAEIAIYILCLIVTLIHAVSGITGRFWHVTDFHNDQTYWTGGLSCTASVSNPGKYGDYRCDPPWLLVQDSIAAMAQIYKDVDFIVWTGDSVAHLDNQYTTLDNNIAILQNVTKALKAAFPETPIYASLGNHDFYPRDLANGSEREMYRRVAEMWADWINDPSQLELFKKGGYYTKHINSKIRMIVLNTVLYYQQGGAQNITQRPSDPAEQFAWLDTVLTASRSAGEKVIITAHVPPTLGPLSLIEWFHPVYAAKYVNLMFYNSDIILAHHYGQDHRDTFRILQRENGSGASAIFIAPAVTPDEINPGIRLVEYDRNTGQHINYHQYYLNLTEANRQNRTHWAELYNFQDAYRITDMSVDSLRSIYSRMKEPNSEEMSKYNRYHRVGHLMPSRYSEREKGILWCSGQIVNRCQATTCVDQYITNGAGVPTEIVGLVVLTTALQISLFQG